MTPEQALKILADASAEFRGTRADHETIKKAVETLAVLVTPKTEEK